MKKIIISIFMFISVIGYLISFENVRTVYELSLLLSSEQSQKITEFMLSSNDYSKANDEKIAEGLLSLCEENHVSMIKTSPIDGYHLKNYIYMAENLYEDVGLTLSNKQVAALNDNKNFLITNDLDKKANLYLPYFPVDSRQYIYNYKNLDFVDGTYTLIGENSDKVLSIFKRNFTGISIGWENDEAIKIDKDITHSDRIHTLSN